MTVHAIAIMNPLGTLCAAALIGALTACRGPHDIPNSITIERDLLTLQTDADRTTGEAVADRAVEVLEEYRRRLGLPHRRHIQIRLYRELSNSARGKRLAEAFVRRGPFIDPMLVMDLSPYRAGSRSGSRAAVLAELLQPGRPGWTHTLRHELLHAFTAGRDSPHAPMQEGLAQAFAALPTADGHWGVEPLSVLLLRDPTHRWRTPFERLTGPLPTEPAQILPAYAEAWLYLYTLHEHEGREAREALDALIRSGHAATFPGSSFRLDPALARRSRAVLERLHVAITLAAAPETRAAELGFQPGDRLFLRGLTSTWLSSITRRIARTRDELSALTPEARAKHDPIEVVVHRGEQSLILKVPAQDYVALKFRIAAFDPALPKRDRGER